MLQNKLHKFQMEMKLDLEFLGIPKNSNLQDFKTQKILRNSQKFLGILGVYRFNIMLQSTSNASIVKYTQI